VIIAVAGTDIKHNSFPKFFEILIQPGPMAHDEFCQVVE
jgi:hypothetical protein